MFIALTSTPVSSKSRKSVNFGIIRLRIYRVDRAAEASARIVRWTENTMKVYGLRRLGVALALLFATAGANAPDTEEYVRVRLFSGKLISSVDVSDAAGEQLTLYDSSGALATLDNAQKIGLDVWNEFLRARWQSGSAPMDRALIKSSSGTITVDIGGESRSYHGSLELTLDGDIERPGLVLINEVSLSDYVSSVLPAEYGFTEPEGMKALAIVIRTYALRARSEREGAYHLTDDTGSQVYMGISSETDLARAAVEATSGMTVTHDGQLIEAVYSAHCGGHSANNEDVWSSHPVSYLRGREDPFDGDAPVARWTSSVDKNDLLDHFSRKYGSTVKDIDVSERGSGGRATMIMLDAKGKDVNITAQSFRVAVNDRFGPSAIKSTLFDIEKKGVTYEFSGRGLGHGVGLCQWGAAAQARKGRSYRDILSFYYQDVEIEGYESDAQVTSAPLADAGLVRPDPEPADRVAPPQQVKPKQTRQIAAKQVPKPKRWTQSDRGESTSSDKLSGQRVGW